MLITLFLARVIGVYLIIGGLAVLMDRSRLMLAVVALTKERFAQLIAGVLALITGLVLVNLVNDWSSLPALIVSLTGWVAILKGALYLLMPEKELSKMMQMFMDRKWYVLDGALVLLAGIYVAGFGYGLW